jgi:O-antigen ligase
MTNVQPVHDLTYKAITLFICLSFFSLSVGTAPLTLSSLTALAIWLLSGRCYRDRADWLGQEWLVPVSALCVLPWVAILWSSAPVDQSVNFAERSHYWLFAFLAASAMKSERTVQSVMVCFISGTTIIAILLCLYSNGIVPETAYLQKFSDRSYITYSLFIVVSILLLAFFYNEATTLCTKLPVAALILFLAITITQLKGRSAYLSLALLSPWLFATMFGRRLFPVLVAVLVTLALMSTSPRVRERLALIPKEIKMYQSGASSYQTAIDGTQHESSIGLRLMVWSDALKIFQRYPLFGAGTGAYQHEAEIINPEDVLPHPHNSYLYILANYGILGIGLYGWLCAVTLRRSWRVRGQLSGHSILAFLLVILIGSLTDTQVLSAATGIVLGFISGLPTPPTTECAS